MQAVQSIMVFTTNSGNSHDVHTVHETSYPFFRYSRTHTPVPVPLGGTIQPFDDTTGSPSPSGTGAGVLVAIFMSPTVSVYIRFVLSLLFHSCISLELHAPFPINMYNYYYTLYTVKNEVGIAHQICSTPMV